MSTLETNSIGKYNGNNVSVDDALKLKNYTTTQRDALTSVAGDSIYNTTTSKVEYYTGSAWVETGGADIVPVEYLAVAGGGGGGSGWNNTTYRPGGGGGADAYHNHPFVASAGGYVFKIQGGFDPSDVGLDNEGALASAEYLDTLVKEGVVASTDYGASMSAFQEGRSLFWMTGPWARNDASAVNYNVGLIPSFSDSPATPFVGVRGAMVSSFSEKRLLAESFILDFFVTVEVQEAMYNSDPRLPATKSLFAIVEAADPIAAQFAASAANGIPMPNIPEMGSVWGPFGDALLIIRDQAYGTNEETGVTVNSASDAMKLAAEQVRTAIAGG